MAIIIILCAIAIPSVNGARDRAKILSDKTGIQTMNNAIALHTTVNGWDNLVGQTSISVFQPIKNGDSVSVLLQYLKDNNLIQQTAQIYYPIGHSYDASKNVVN